MKQTQPVNLHKVNIPRLIEERLQNIKHPRKDNLRIIIDLIYTRSQRFKNSSQKAYGFIQIPYTTFKCYLPNEKNIKDDIDYLVDNDIIIRNSWFDYQNGEARGYKISGEFLSSTVKVTVSNMKINKKIHDFRNSERERREKNVQYLKTDYYLNFKIKYNEAIEFVYNQSITGIKDILAKIRYRMNNSEILDLINGNGQYQIHKAVIIKSGASDTFFQIINRHISYIHAIENINDGFLFFKRNKTNGRLDTNLTSLPSCLRPFLISDSPLYSIDLKSSQPFFLYTEIKDNPNINPDELELYKNLVVSGDTDNGLYEFICDEYRKGHNKSYTRNDAKQLIFKLFYSETTSFRKQREFFSTFFPTILEYIDGKKTKSYKDFSVYLQAIESKTMLDTIVPKLQPLKIKPYTIHDSFIVRYEDVDKVYNTTVDTIKEMYGYCPKLHLDCITSGAIEDRNDNNETELDFELDFFEATADTDEVSEEPNSTTYYQFDEEAFNNILNIKLTNKL